MISQLYDFLHFIFLFFDSGINGLSYAHFTCMMYHTLGRFTSSLITLEYQLPLKSCLKSLWWCGVASDYSVSSISISPAHQSKIKGINKIKKETSPVHQSTIKAYKIKKKSQWQSQWQSIWYWVRGGQKTMTTSYFEPFSNIHLENG